MMSNRVQTAIMGIALIVVCSTGTAEAAKGVKKVAAGAGQRTLTGEVLSVTPKNGGVSFQVRTASHHKKQGAAAVAKPATVHDLQATAATTLVNSNGTPAFPASVHHGVRVRVQATGGQATNVQILTHNHTAAHFTRYRTQAYRPHNSYAHLHLHPSHHHYHHSAHHHRR
jgi:hypothetical protein